MDDDDTKEVLGDTAVKKEIDAQMSVQNQVSINKLLSQAEAIEDDVLMKTR